MADLNTSGLDQLAADLRGAPLRVAVAARSVMERGALNVKRGMADDARGIGHLPHLPSSISYDIDVRGNEIIAEIGADPRKPDWTQTALAHIAAFGLADQPPEWPYDAALDREAPELERYLGDAAEDMLP